MNLRCLTSVGGAVLLAACVYTGQDGFRDQTAPISASTRFDPKAFSGTWVVAAGFLTQSAQTVTVTYDAKMLQLQLTPDDPSGISGNYREGMPGELIPVESGKETLVIMWVDEDFETAAIGTPSGRFGAVLDRDGVLPSDRYAAARDVFEFYGWQTTALERTGI